MAGLMLKMMNPMGSVPSMPSVGAKEDEMSRDLGCLGFQSVSWSSNDPTLLKVDTGGVNDGIFGMYL